MPTYVYECKKCEKVFEAEQRITADPLTDCDCGAKGSLRRVIQPVGVVFSGPGFHINDYAASTSSSSGSASDAGKAEKTKKEAEPETKSDAKPEAPKAEPKPETKKATEK